MPAPRPPSPRNPPPEVGVVTFLSPNKSDQGLIEIWNTNLGKYTPIDVGTPHPDSRQYPGYRLGNQRPLGNDTDWVIRTWVTDETSPDWFNWSLKFSGEDDSFPIFVRIYRERRDTYVPREKATPLSTLYKTEITFAGSGYAVNALPTVEFHDPLVVPDTVAVAHAVVAPDGTISEVILDNGGEGYLEPCSFRVAGPVNGEAATGIAFVQPQSAILIKEEAALFPPDSEFYADYLQVTRVYETIPGPTNTGVKLDDDGALIGTSTTRKLCSEITPGETINDPANVWKKTILVPTDSDIICEEVIIFRAIPGNEIISVTLDVDGMNKTVAKRYQDVNAFTPVEGISSGTWLKVEREDVSGSELVVWEIGTSRPIPGNLIDTTHIDENGDILTETRQMVQAGFPTTDTIVANVWAKTFEEPVSGSDIVAWKVVQVRDTQNNLDSYSIQIPDLIPEEFRPQIPVKEHAQTIIGYATAQTLAEGQLFVEERQLDDYTYRRTVRGREDIDLPQTVTNKELTEEYGGGVVNVTLTLDILSHLTIDEGLTVLDSSIKKLDSLPDGLAVKTTKQLDDDEWPILIGTEVDPRTGIVIGITKQVVDDGAVGGVTVDGYIDVKPIDKWRSLTIASKLDPDTLPEPVEWETTAEFTFKNTLLGATWLWASATADCCDAFDMTLEYDIDEGYAGPCRAKVTESYTNGPPLDVVAITQFFPKAHMVGFAWAWASISDECGARCKANVGTFFIPSTLHEEITIAGSVIMTGGSFTDTLAATVPTGLPAPGTLITVNVDVERWRFGIFMRRITEIYVPG